MKRRSLIRPRAASVVALIEPTRRGNVLAVHDFRVAARSLRAGLRTLAARPRATGIRETRRVLQTAIRALAETRDRDVGRTLLLKRKGATPEQAAFRRRTLGLVESDRRIALTRADASWPRSLDARLIALLTRAEPSLATVLRRTRAEAFRQRGRALVLVSALGRRFDPIRLHELRRRVRSLRYALEAIAEVDVAAPAKAARLKPLQGALGYIQDRIVLSRWLAGHAARFRRKDPTMARDLRAAASEARAHSREAHRRFLGLRPRLILEALAVHVDAEGEGPLQSSVPRDRRPQVGAPRRRLNVRTRRRRSGGARATEHS